jgi:hypothetical protein
MELQIQKIIDPIVRQKLQKRRTFGHKQLQADFEEAHFVSQKADEPFGFRLIGHIQGEDQAVFGVHLFPVFRFWFFVFRERIN